MIDGVNNTNIRDGGVGSNFQSDFIQEVQVKSSSFEAEYGGALGGVINAIPKRGTNVWHGALLTYLQMNNLNAIDPCLSGMTAGYNGPNFTGPTAANVNATGTFAAATGQACGLRINPTLA